MEGFQNVNGQFDYPGSNGGSSSNNYYSAGPDSLLSNHHRASAPEVMIHITKTQSQADLFPRKPLGKMKSQPTLSLSLSLPLPPIMSFRA